MVKGGSGTTDVTIRIEKAQSGQIDAIVRVLELLGLARIERHDRFAMINGSVDADRLDLLRQVKGVASVREDRIYRPQ